MINKKECLSNKIKRKEDSQDKMNKNKKEWLYRMNNRIEDSKDKINKIKEKLTDSMIKNSKEDINNEELWLID